MGVRSGRMRGTVISRDVVLGTPGGFLKQRGNANKVEQRVASTFATSRKISLLHTT